jgi:hypothetical protein
VRDISDRINAGLNTTIVVLAKIPHVPRITSGKRFRALVGTPRGREAAIRHCAATVDGVVRKEARPRKTEPPSQPPRCSDNYLKGRYDHETVKLARRLTGKAQLLVHRYPKKFAVLGLEAASTSR